MRELLAAIRAVAAGHRVLPAILPRLRSQAAARLATADRAIFAMRLAGTSTAEMAAVVGLGTNELRTRLAAIVAALNGLRDPVPSSPLHGAARPRSTAA